MPTRMNLAPPSLVTVDDGYLSSALCTQAAIERLFATEAVGGLAVARSVLRCVADRLAHAGELLRDVPNHDMVARLCDVLSQMQDAKEFGPQDLAQLRNAMLRVDTIVEPLLEGVLRGCIETLSFDGPVSVISLGCGNGYLESSLAARLNLPLRWIGMDHRSVIANAPTDTIFRSPGNRFVAIDGSEQMDYRSLAGLRPHEPAVLLACYSVHHLPYPFDTFRRRSAGCQTVLLEQPVTVEEWRWPPFRWLFVAYDLYANIAFNPGWAAEFLVSPQRFTVDYLTLDALSHMSAEVDTVKGVTPRTSVIKLPMQP